MSNSVKNLIEYVGISESLPSSSEVFRQLYVEKTYCLPPAKPDIEQIVKVISELKIKTTNVIKTPKGTSLEGQMLTGFKVIIEGVLVQKIQYVAEESTQTVHAAHFEIPFSTYIVLPENYVVGTPVTVLGYIEDIFSMPMDKRCIFNNITILLEANFC